VDGAETNEEGEKAAEAEGREEGSGAAEGGDRRAVSNGNFRRDGSLRMPRRVVSMSKWGADCGFACHWVICLFSGS
jgi:hypothetical protein